MKKVSFITTQNTCFSPFKSCRNIDNGRTYGGDYCLKYIFKKQLHSNHMLATIVIIMNAEIGINIIEAILYQFQSVLKHRLQNKLEPT